jgi:tetratricopeptide (TPR) repeat protein
MKPRVFVGSSVEALPIAYALQKNLRHQAEVTVWDQGIFQLSNSSLQSLVSALETFDFGIFVFSFDDIVIIRGEEHRAVRDNVVFELGLFIGELGQTRCFILIPDGSEDLRLPTDLLGVEPGTYEHNRSDNNWEAATGPVCSDVRRQLQLHGRKSIGEEHAEGTAPVVEASEVSPKKTDLKPLEESQPAQESIPGSTWLDYFINGMTEKAIPEIEKEIAVEQDAEKQFNLRLWRALFHFELSIEKGEEEFRILVREAPGKPAPWIELTRAFLHSEFREKALALVEEGLAAIPGDQALLITKTQCLDALQRPDEAERLLKKSIKSVDSASEALVAQLARLQLVHGKPLEALASVAYGLERLPLSTELLELKASILSSSNEHAGAISVYRQLMRLNPKEPSYCALMGNALLALEFYGLAMDAYRRADSMVNGSLAWITANIGNALNNKGFFGFAVEYFEKALVEDPSSDYAQERILSAKRNQSAEMQRLEAAINQAISRTLPVEIIDDGDSDSEDVN